MEVKDETILMVLNSKNFKKFVVWAKNWQRALRYFSNAVEEIENGGVVNDVRISKKLIELKIISALKKEGISQEDVEAFFRQYQMWAYDNNFPVPRKIDANRIRNIKALLRNFSENDIRRVFEKATKSDFLLKNNFFALDWVTNLGNFRKVQEGNYDNKEQTGVMGAF